MKHLAPLLEGTHDFSAFAASDDKDELGLSKIRTIYSSSLYEEPNRLVYRVRGNGFLKHMVRNIIGTLIEAGKGNLDEPGLLAFLRPGFLDEPGARKAGPRAPACGLFLVSVEYPDILLNPPPRPAHAGPFPQDETVE
jgi:tRNA pseudouridine38-40 synthase